MKAQLGSFTNLFIIVLLFAISAFVLNTFISAFWFYLPVQTALNSFANIVYGFVDASLVIICILGIVISLYTSYENPSVIKAILNVVGIFILGYFGLLVNNIIGITPIFNSTRLPNTTAFLTGGYKMYLLLFALVLSAVLNLRHKESEGNI